MKRFIKSIRKKYNIQEIETTIIYQYIKNKDLKKNNFFINYFKRYPVIEDKKIIKKFKTNATLNNLFNIFDILIKDKKMAGVYYTSKNIIELMINNIVFKKTDKIIDIGCGVSNFLYFIGKKIKYQNPEMKMKDIVL